jgi:excisionase family DNA binding protein
VNGETGPERSVSVFILVKMEESLVNEINKTPGNKGLYAMLTTSEVARLLNVHINTVRRWTNRGELKTYRIGSRGDRRFDPEDIASFLGHKSEKFEASQEKAALAT